MSNGDKRGLEKTKNRRRKKDRKDYNVGPTEKPKRKIMKASEDLHSQSLLGNSGEGTIRLVCTSWRRTT